MISEWWSRLIKLSTVLYYPKIVPFTLYKQVILFLKWGNSTQHCLETPPQTRPSLPKGQWLNQMYQKKGQGVISSQWIMCSTNGYLVATELSTCRAQKTTKAAFFLMLGLWMASVFAIFFLVLFSSKGGGGGEKMPPFPGFQPCLCVNISLRKRHPKELGDNDIQKRSYEGR